MGDHQSVDQLTSFFMPLHGIYPAPLSCQSASLRYATTVRCILPWRRAYSQGIISHGLSCRCDELCLFEALHPAPLARPFSKGLLAGDCLTWTFIPLRRIVPLRGTPSCAFGAALLQGPTRGGLFHMDFYAVAMSCASSRHSILRLWRGPSLRAYLRGIISHGLSCRCSELCLFEALYPAPLARPFSKGLREGGIF